MEAKHTPGPWFVSHREPSVCSIWRRDPKELYENGGTVAGERPLATVWPGWTGPDETGFPVLANARLMAAAPDLLNVARWARNAMREAFDGVLQTIPEGSAVPPWMATLETTIADAEHAITKATGGEG
jgi:hypothetical protein